MQESINEMTQDNPRWLSDYQNVSGYMSEKFGQQTWHAFFHDFKCALTVCLSRLDNKYGEHVNEIWKKANIFLVKDLNTGNYAVVVNVPIGADHYLFAALFNYVATTTGQVDIFSFPKELVIQRDFSNKPFWKQFLNNPTEALGVYRIGGVAKPQELQQVSGEESLQKPIPERPFSYQQPMYGGYGSHQTTYSTAPYSNLRVGIEYLCSLLVGAQSKEEKFQRIREELKFLKSAVSRFGDIVQTQHGPMSLSDLTMLVSFIDGFDPQ